MGVSTDAILFYGYVWTDEEKAIPEEWVEVEAKRQGFTNPWDFYDERAAILMNWRDREKYTKEWTDLHRKELDEWWDRKRDIEESFGVYVGYHCSNDYPMSYLAVRQSRLVAHRGDPKPLTAERMEVGSDWNEKLDRFCDRFGVTKPHPEPGWWLVSNWG